MAKKDEIPEASAYTLAQLREIVAAGMGITEAKTLLDEGYAPADVLDLAQLQASQRADQAAAQQTATAKAMQKAMRPENETHPGISAFSYPEGDVARPKPAPAYEFFYNGFPVHKSLETHHWRECELMKDVEPGEYTVIRKDTTRMTVTVRGERDADGKLTKIDLSFPVSREEKPLVPPMMSVLYQIVHAKDMTPKEAFLRATQEHLGLILGEAVGVV